MSDLSFFGIILSLGISSAALILMYHERNWAQKKYKQELRQTLLQPGFIDKLRKELAADVRAHVNLALQPLNKEIKQVISSITEETETELKKTLEQNKQILAEAATERNAQLKEILSGSGTSLESEIADLTKDIAKVKTEYETTLNDYRNKVMNHVKTMVDSEAADLLADYLNASLKGVEIGNQQELILARLEENKDDILKELA